jgi:hypothetical protein
MKYDRFQRSSPFFNLECSWSCASKRGRQRTLQLGINVVLVPSTSITAGITIQLPGTLYYPAITVTLGHPFQMFLSQHIPFINFHFYVSVLFYTLYPHYCVSFPFQRSHAFYLGTPLLPVTHLTILTIRLPADPPYHSIWAS